jgi:hypothetical protein
MRSLTGSDRRGTMAVSSFGHVLDAVAAPAIAVLFFVAVQRFYPYDAFLRNPDEGHETMKALLVSHGYPLHDQIWNDQPPLFTHLLSICFQLFDPQIVYARSLVLICAALLVFAVYDSVQRCWNHVAGFAAALGLVASTHFLPLSVSAMGGVPSLAFAMLSLWALVRWRLADRRRWLVASGLLMSMSLGIKLFTVFLVPVFAAWLLLVRWLERREHAWQPAFVWLSCVCVSTAIVLFTLVGPANLEQLVAPHAAARGAGVFADRLGVRILMQMVPADLPLVLLAGLGTLLIIMRRCWDLALPPLWAAAALLCLLPHAPVWHHHYLLLTVAAAPCAGVAVAEVFGFGRRVEPADGAAPGPVLVRVVGGGALLLLIYTLPISLAVSTSGDIVGWENARTTLDAMQPFAGATHFVLTDSPIYAFYAGLDTVPDLAVVSLKRINTGFLTSADVVGTLARYEPEQVLLTGVFPAAISDPLVSAMRDRYTLVFSTAGLLPARLYVRHDIVAQAIRNGAFAAAVRPDPNLNHELH